MRANSAWTACVLSFLLLGSSLAPSAGQDDTADAAFDAFWAAPTPPAAHAAARSIVESGVSFDEAFRRLKKGRAYARRVPTGVVDLSRRADGEEFFFSLDVPATYEPSKTYRVRFQLHGGVGAGEDNRPRGSGAIRRFRGDEQIYIAPTSWLDAPWWSDVQLENLRAILHQVKRTYNVDENRVVLSGESDGGTGAFYVAMRDTTPYASFMPLNGSLLQLATRALGLGDLYPNNLRNKPFFVVNGGRDILYPTRAVTPVVRDLQKAGVDVVYRPQPDAGHDAAWWPDVKAAFEQFAREHPRIPYPETLTWQSGGNDAFNRAHWLVIDRLGMQPSPVLPDVNVVATPQTLHFGVLASGAHVTRVIPRSNAAALGLQAGDVIAELNGRTVSPDAELAPLLESCCRDAPQIELIVSRAGQRVSLSGALGRSTAFGPTVPMFARRRPVGRVDLVKTGNTVEATTSGVAEFTLLLSPEAFDFRQPVTVITNGALSARRLVVRSVETLVKWAAIDHDRTMLFGAELRISVD